MKDKTLKIFVWLCVCTMAAMGLGAGVMYLALLWNLVMRMYS